MMCLSLYASTAFWSKTLMVYQGFRPLDVSAYLKEDTSSMILTKSSIRWFRKSREAEPFDQFMLAFQKRRWEKD